MLENMRQSLQQTILSAVETQNGAILNLASAQGQTLNNNTNNTNTATAGGYQTWTWGGRFHFVPSNFKFPTSSNLSTLWLLWWDGKPAERIAPYRKLEPHDFETKRNKTYFIKGRKVMEFFTAHTGTEEAAIKGSSTADKVQLFAECILSNIFTVVWQ
jgi:hypothetical protein